MLQVGHPPYIFFQVCKFADRKVLDVITAKTTGSSTPSARPHSEIVYSWDEQALLQPCFTFIDLQ